MSEQQTFRTACLTKWRKTADMKKLRHCYPMYTYGILKTNISQTRVAQAKLMPGPTWPDPVSF